MQAVNPVKKAIELAGGQEALAKAIGCRQPRVSDWLKRGWPAAHACLAIERATGVTVAELLAPAERSKKAKPKKRRVAA